MLWGWLLRRHPFTSLMHNQKKRHFEMLPIYGVDTS